MTNTENVTGLAYRLEDGQGEVVALTRFALAAATIVQPHTGMIRLDVDDGPVLWREGSQQDGSAADDVNHAEQIILNRHSALRYHHFHASWHRETGGKTYRAIGAKPFQSVTAALDDAKRLTGRLNPDVVSCPRRGGCPSVFPDQRRRQLVR